MTDKPSRRFAEGTKVAKTVTLDKLEKYLNRHGCTDFLHMSREDAIHILFNINAKTPDERRIRFSVPKPRPEDFVGLMVKAGGAPPRPATPAQIQAKLDAETDRVYRVIARSIEGKLLAVDEGIETAEQALYQHIVTPDGATVYEASREQVADAYRTGKVGNLLPGLPANRAVLTARFTELEDKSK